MKKNPDWYWEKGLHDSKILSVKLITLNYNYTEKNPKRNYLLFKIDSSQAMFDTNISEIKFYNAKLNIDSNLLINSYWESDKIFFDKKYTLELISAKVKSKILCRIEFDDAEVIYNSRK